MARLSPDHIDGECLLRWRPKRAITILRKLRVCSGLWAEKRSNFHNISYMRLLVSQSHSWKHAKDFDEGKTTHIFSLNIALKPKCLRAHSAPAQEPQVSLRDFSLSRLSLSRFSRPSPSSRPLASAFWDPRGKTFMAIRRPSRSLFRFSLPSWEHLR